MWVTKLNTGNWKPLGQVGTDKTDNTWHVFISTKSKEKENTCRVSAWCKRDENKAFSLKDCCGGECPCPSPSLKKWVNESGWGGWIDNISGWLWKLLAKLIILFLSQLARKGGQRRGRRQGEKWSRGKKGGWGNRGKERQCYQWAPKFGTLWWLVGTGWCH